MKIEFFLSSLLLVAAPTLAREKTDVIVMTIRTIYSKGDLPTQFNRSSPIEYLQENWKAGTSFNSSVSGSSGDKTSTRNQVGLSFLHLLPRKNCFTQALVVFCKARARNWP